MECPQHPVELTELSSSDDKIHVCSDCTGEWIDGSQLNALLLHSNLPGVETLGGRVDPDAETGTCPTCGVSMVRIEQVGRRQPLDYEACEDCGFVYVPRTEGEAAADFTQARAYLVDFFSRFVAKPGAKP